MCLPGRKTIPWKERRAQLDALQLARMRAADDTKLADFSFYSGESRGGWGVRVPSDPVRSKEGLLEATRARGHHLAINHKEVRREVIQFISFSAAAFSPVHHGLG